MYYIPSTVKMTEYHYFRAYNKHSAPRQPKFLYKFPKTLYSISKISYQYDNHVLLGWEIITH